MQVFYLFPVIIPTGDIFHPQKFLSQTATSCFWEKAGSVISTSVPELIWLYT
jgi:hypothetical protein